jgi:hypothetical protein
MGYVIIFTIELIILHIFILGFVIKAYKEGY